MSESSYNAGVRAYRDTYWDGNYQPIDTDFLACFKITPQKGIEREEIAAAVAAESSTGTWTTVWTDHLTDVDYYKARLRNNGREIFETPATQQFELGRFDDDTMAFPPSVVVKDYSWSGWEGYLVVQGTTERRFKTIIQIVPGAGGR